MNQQLFHCVIKTYLTARKSPRRASALFTSFYALHKLALPRQAIHHTTTLKRYNKTHRSLTTKTPVKAQAKNTDDYAKEAGSLQYQTTLKRYFLQVLDMPCSLSISIYRTKTVLAIKLVPGYYFLQIRNYVLYVFDSVSLLQCNIRNAYLKTSLQYRNSPIIVPSLSY